MNVRSRLQALEARQRRQHPPGDEHFTSIVRVPADIAHEDWLDWLASQPCACGRSSCDQRRVGIVVPERLSPEQWTARYRPQPGGRTDGL
jgi:hypothetical protein